MSRGSTMLKGSGTSSREIVDARMGLIFHVLLAAALLALAPPSWAQQAPSANASNASAGQNTLQEIVVTAEKRSETVQSTPMSVTASSGGQAPTVGFYLDDTPLTPPNEALLGRVVIDPTLYDLNRVEVLRGPQGTLFGSSSMGGTIKLVTNQPDPSGIAVSAQAIASDTKDGGLNYTVNGMLNLPLADKLALRIVGTDSYTGGWIDRVVLNPFPLETNGGFP